MASTSVCRAVQTVAVATRSQLVNCGRLRAAYTPGHIHMMGPNAPTLPRQQACICWRRPQVSRLLLAMLIAAVWADTSQGNAPPFDPSKSANSVQLTCEAVVSSVEMMGATHIVVAACMYQCLCTASGCHITRPFERVHIVVQEVCCQCHCGNVLPPQPLCDKSLMQAATTNSVLPLCRAL